VPQLHLQGLAKGLLDLELVCDVNIYKSGLADTELLQVELLQ
jgi:hypothetical protein